MSGLETRSTARDSLFLLADLMVDTDKTRHRVKIRNLSASGLMAEGDVPVVRGNRVQIDVRNAGLVWGTVAWKEGARFGVAFEEEIDPSKVREALLSPREFAPKVAPYAPRVNTGRPVPPDPAKLRKV